MNALPRRAPVSLMSRMRDRDFSAIPPQRGPRAFSGFRLRPFPEQVRDWYLFRICPRTGGKSVTSARCDAAHLQTLKVTRRARARVLDRVIILVGKKKKKERDSLSTFLVKNAKTTRRICGKMDLVSLIFPNKIFLTEMRVRVIAF